VRGEEYLLIIFSRALFVNDRTMRGNRASLTVFLSFWYVLSMKKYLIPVIFILMFSCGTSYGFEISGLQPLAPNGIFSTFSTSSLPKRHFAVSTDVELSFEPNFARFFLKGAYGITDTVQLSMNIPYIHGSDYPDGFEDIALGVQHRFFDEGKYGPSLAYILTASFDSGVDAFTTGGRVGVGLLLSKKVGPVKGHANIFFVMPGKGDLDNEVAFFAGLDFAATHNIKLLAELYSKTSFKTGKVESVEGRFGYRIKTADALYTTLGVGFDFKNRNPEARLMFSVTYVPPLKKKAIQKIYEEE
jgi:hypothetical protein